MTELSELVKKISSSTNKNAIDAVLKLTEQDSSIMHTEINQPQIMNALKVASLFAEQKRFPKTKAVFDSIYDSQVLHMVSYKRKRPIELVKVLSSLTAMLGIQKSKTTLFGEKSE